MSTHASCEQKNAQGRKIFSFAEHVKQLLKESSRSSQISSSDAPSCSSTSRKKKIIISNSNKADEGTKEAAVSSTSRETTYDFQTPLKGAKNEDEALKLTKKVTELQPGHEYTPETRNKFSQRNSQVANDNVSTAKPFTFGKRKLEYSDSTQNKMEKKATEEFSNQTTKKQKPIQVPASRVSYKMYKTPNGEYFIPVYLEKDLAYTKKIQETLRELDMDNDCETETDVLETAIKTVLEDLEYALKSQREEDKKKKTSSIIYTPDSEISADESGFECVGENSTRSNNLVSNKEGSINSAQNGKKNQKNASI